MDRLGRAARRFGSRWAVVRVVAAFSAVWVVDFGSSVTAALLPAHINSSFGAATIPVGGATSLAFSIGNPNQGTGLSSIGFSDSLPGGLVVANPSGVSNDCGGTATATAGSSTVSLSSATLAPGGLCSMSVQVVGVAAGVQSNSVTVGSSAGTGNTSTASVTVVAPPEMTMQFGTPFAPGPGPWVASSTVLPMTFGLVNSNTTTSLTGIGFTDTLPGGFVVAKPNGLVGSCGGGTISAKAGTQVISLTNATLTPGPTDPNSVCQFMVNVKAVANGYWTNSTGLVASNEGGSGVPSSASISVIRPGAEIYGDNFDPSGGNLWFARLDGSVGSSILAKTPVCGPGGVSIDTVTGRLYWADSGCSSPNISFNSFDATAYGTLNTAGGGAALGLGVAVDHAVGRVYWAGINGTAIGSARLDGSGGSALSTSGATVSGATGLAIDQNHGRVYWANRSANIISYAAINGSGGADLTITGTTPNFPSGIAVDPGSGRIYWANQGNNTIASAKLNGTAGSVLNTGGVTVDNPIGIAIDPVAGRIYWANEGDTTIGYANLNGSGGGGGTFSAPGLTLAAPNFLSILYPPSGTQAPTITGGSTAGSTLTCSKGGWAKDVLGDLFYQAPHSFTYAWTQNGVIITGAKSKSLSANSTGDYRCKATATNQAGSTTQTSAIHTIT